MSTERDCVLTSNTTRLTGEKVPWRVVALWLSLIISALPAHPNDASMRFHALLTPDGVPVAMVNGLAEDTDGAIWAVTWGEGVHRIQGTEWTAYTEEDGLPDNWVRSICASSEGGVWIGTGEGIARIHDGKLEALTRDNFPLLKHGEVSFIKELNDGRIWAGTADGEVLVREPDSTAGSDLTRGWARFATTEDTGGRVIYQILETGPGELLISLRDKGLAWIRGDLWESDELGGADRW